MRSFIITRALAAAFLGATAFYTSGCTPIPQPAPTPQQTIVVPQLVCPVLKKYSDQFYAGLQTDLEAMKNKYPYANAFMIDASNMRHAIEACSATQKTMREGGAH